MPFTIQRQKVQVADVRGRFQRLHRQTAVALQAIFFLVPWIPVNGHPMVQFDLVARRLYAFGAVFTPRDTFFLVLIGLIGAFGLFFFTSLYGRIWCGYACPQSFFLEEWIRPIERWIEGSRGKRMQLDRAPWSFDKAWRKLAKWTLFAVAAAVIASTFTTWFSGARAYWTGAAPAGAYSFAGAVALFLFADFVWFREQACNYLCPYARFQGALTDDHSLVVSYDFGLGEPRGKKGKVEGDCIDCKKCVTVCPQGIDIRQGFQLECITCGRCVDACHGVMDKFGQASLIRYTTQAAEEGRETRGVRPRTVAYSVILTLLISTFVIGLATRTPLQAHLQRLPGTLYQIDEDGWTRNTFLLQLAQNAGSVGDGVVTVELVGIDEAELIVPQIELAHDQQTTVPVIVRLAPEALTERTLPLTLVVRSGDQEIEVSGTFKSEGADASEEAS